MPLPFLTRRQPTLVRDGSRTLLRESVIWSTPAIVGLAVLGAAGLVGPGSLLIGWLASFAVASWLAHARLREIETIAAWIERLPTEQNGVDPEATEGTLSDRLLRPVTELAKQVRRQSRRAASQEQMLASVIDAVPDPILVVDREHVVVRANGAAQRGLDGVAPAVPLARVLRDPGVAAAVQAAITAGTTSDATFSPASDRAKQFTARVEPVDLGQRGRGVLIALRERTEEVLIERMRSDFVANASHEIRTPLASILGIVETLRGPAKHDSQAREMFLGLMDEEAGRMTRLVDDLLSLSRIELAANRPPTEPCLLTDVIGQLVDRMTPIAAKAGVTLTAETDTELPPILGDADQLLQLLANLVDNAIKYGGDGKTIGVRTAVVEAPSPEYGPLAGRRCVEVAVEDQGPGIAAEHIPRLTERFYRVDNARSRRLRGTGLGLAIVKHILRRHQGHLSVSSEIGRGSTFTVLLPVASAPGS